MKIDADDLDVNCLNEIVLNEEELLQVINDYGKARDMGLCPEATGRIAESRVYQENPDKAEAIMVRLHALSRMIENEDLNNWLIAEGLCVMPSIANQAVVSAAAVHPLCVIDGGISFEKESFLRRILEMAETEGGSRN